MPELEADYMVSANGKFRIVFMGTPEFAVPALKALVGSGHDICAVVSQPDRKKGRGRKVVPTPVKVVAEAAGLKVLQPEKVREPEFLDTIRELAPDLLVVAAFGQILPQALLDIPSIMPINIHGSLLPALRGAAPIQWAIIQGLDRTGITIMEMDAGMDTGPMLLQDGLDIGPDETFGSLYQRMADLGARLITDALDLLAQGKLEPVAQPEEGITMAPPIKKEMAHVDWKNSNREIHCLIRAMDPAPGAYTMWKGQRLRIYSPELISMDASDAEPGTVCAVEKDKVTVACGDGCLALGELQWPGKKRLACAEFLRGRPVKPGEKFE